MAKSFLSLTLKAMKAAERERVHQAKAAERRDIAEHRETVRRAKAHEADVRKTASADERDRKSYEKELKTAHAASQQAEVDSLNSQIEDVFEDLATLLEATINVDDYVDLEALRKPVDATPFDLPQLEVAVKPPRYPSLPLKPTYVEPEKPKGFFGKKRKLAEAQEKARQTHDAQKARWIESVAALKSKYDNDTVAHQQAEAERIGNLAKEKVRFNNELEEHNRSIDQFISDLSYGDATAVNEYISLVVGNSIYPDHLAISHDFSFDPETAELRMQVTIPNPRSFPSVKAYKYVKASDEIREIPLPKTEFKARYCSVLYQIAIRSLHEVFEADRRGLIQTIALQVGTEGNDPATGNITFLPFVGVSAERDSFMEFDLSGLVPLATLKHLGAAISKDPVNLAVVDVTGVRRS